MWWCCLLHLWYLTFRFWYVSYEIVSYPWTNGLYDLAVEDHVQGLFLIRTICSHSQYVRRTDICSIMLAVACAPLRSIPAHSYNPTPIFVSLITWCADCGDVLSCEMLLLNSHGVWFYVNVDNDSFLRSLASDVVQGRITTKEAREAREESGRGKRRKYAMGDDDEGDDEVSFWYQTNHLYACWW